MQVNNNPCLNCPKKCCIVGLIGLMLSKEEYETYFKEHEQNFLVRSEDKIVFLTAKEGIICPYFENEGCKIYDERPIDCRLYPYQMRLAYETKEKIKFILHSRSDCPRKANLLLPEAEAKALIMDFGKKVYGDKKIIVQNCDNLFARLTNKIEMLLVKLFKGLGVVK